MKILTKEWWIKEQISWTGDSLKIDKRAEKFDEEFFNEIYEKRFCNFSKIFKGRDPILIKQLFLIRQEAIETLYENLPEEILFKIADMRVFALGWTSQAAKEAVLAFAKAQRRINRETLKLAQRGTEEAELRLSETIGVNEYGGLKLKGIEKRGKELRLHFDKGDLKISDGKILERETKRLYLYDGNEAYRGRSMVLYAELHYENEWFELHFLMENEDEMGRAKPWYLTVKGTDIKKALSQQTKSEA